MFYFGAVFGGNNAGIAVGLQIQVFFLRHRNDILGDFDRDTFAHQKGFGVAVIDLVSVCGNDNRVGKEQTGIFCNL